MSLSETDIAQQIMVWLEAYDWDCYPEAQFYSGGPRADIAALKGRTLWIIECKTGVTLSLLDQVTYWRWGHHCDMVSIATPKYPRGRAAKRYLRDSGIGILVARESLFDSIPLYHVSSRFDDLVHEDTRPRRISRNMKFKELVQLNIDKLHPDMKRYKPGGRTSDGFSTPWKRTMDRAIKYIESHPGVSMKGLVKGIEHHYHTAASADQSLRKWLTIDPAIRVDESARPFKLYPSQKEQKS